MDNAFVIGGTRSIGRHPVSELLDSGYAVTIFNRGNHDNPFEDDLHIQHMQGDRADDEALRTAKLTVAPDTVSDCVAYKPTEVAFTADVFADVDVYAYISSGATYGSEVIPRRGDETLLYDRTDEQTTDDSGASCGSRKTESDRVVFGAASRGINATSIRPCTICGPDDYTGRLDYWTDRVLSYNRVVVPGDGTDVWRRAYIGDVASAIRVVAEESETGEACSVGDRRLVTLEEMVEAIADAAGTNAEVIHAGERELAAAGLSMDDFVLYRGYPHILSTDKLTRLGWESAPVEETVRRSVADHRSDDHDDTEHSPSRDAEERVLSILDML